MMVLIERALLVTGLACLGWYGLAAADAAYTEQQARSAVERGLATAEAERAAAATAVQVPVPAIADDEDAALDAGAESHAEATADASPLAEAAPLPESLAKPGPALPTPKLTYGSNVVGLLQIPRLGFSTPILEGDDAETLRGAAGHLPDTPHPWEVGNSAIAAHRDGIFRPLRNVRVGDELRVQSPHGEIRYRVSDTHIVVPTDLSVLETKTPHMLTLITCYPFNYIGAAPKRFIVHAERVVE
jgi:sortase A